MQQKLQQKGMILAGSGVLILSFDAMLIRISGASTWDVVFWRGWLICLVFTILILCKRSLIQWPTTHLQWLIATLIATLYGINTLLFVFSISNTSTANTVVILASSPLFAAVFSRLCMQEPIKRRVLLTIIASFIGVITIFAGSFNGGHWQGDIAALILALSMGIVLTLLRRYSGLPLLPIIALSGAIAGFIAIPLASPMSLPANSYLWLAIMGLVQMPLATWLLMLAPRFIPSAEVSLFLLIETILGPVWVWLAVGEETPERTLLGGTIILSAIFANTMAAFYEHKRQKRTSTF